MSLVEVVIGSTHHAILVVSLYRDKFAKAIEKELLAKAEERSAHVDLYFFETKLFEIDDVRKLINWHHSFSGGEKCAVISFHSANEYAQNAMLKLIEDTRPGVRFIFVVGQKSAMLPTVLSRVEYYEDEIEIDENIKLAKEFLSSLPTERMNMKGIIRILETKSDGDKKDREISQRFLMSLEDVLSEEKRFTSSNRASLRKMISYCADAGSSPKVIIEYVALLLPRVVL